MSWNLIAAYEHCRQITRRSARTFYWGSLFLPRRKRLATWALYAFCRTVDDIADHPGQFTAPDAALGEWRQRIMMAYEGVVSDLITLAWSDMLRTYPVPLPPALDLIEGMRMDLAPVSPATFADLHLYCYRVAGTIGLLMAPILGYRAPEALTCAVDLGIAMQLTNILRDVGEDQRMGRVYLPRDEMEQFGYSLDDLRQGVIDERFIALMRFQIDRARAYYEQAQPGIDLLDRSAQLAIQTSADLYRGILGEIAENGYDVFTRRAHVSLSAKMLAMPRLWFGMTFGQRNEATTAAPWPSRAAGA